MFFDGTFLETDCMFVCLCKAVSDKKLATLVKEGKETLNEIQNCSEAGKGCGACLKQLETFIQKNRSKQKKIRVSKA